MHIHGSRISTMRMVSQARARRQGRGKILSSLSTGKTANKNNILTGLQTGTTQNTTALANASQLKKYTSYAKMQECAEKLTSGMKELLKLEEVTEPVDTELTEEEKKKLTELKAEEKEAFATGIKNMVTYYNGLCESLQEAGTETNLTFRSQLQEIVKKYETQLQSVGITINSTGTLSFNQTTLKNTDVSELRKLFCESGGFSSKLADKADVVETNASATVYVLEKVYGLSSASSTYTKTGTTNNTSSYHNSLFSYLS